MKTKKIRSITIQDGDSTITRSITESDIASIERMYPHPHHIYYITRNNGDIIEYNGRYVISVYYEKAKEETESCLGRQTN